MCYFYFLKKDFSKDSPTLQSLFQLDSQIKVLLPKFLLMWILLFVAVLKDYLPQWFLC